MPKYPALNIGSKNILLKRLSGNKPDDIKKNKDLIRYCIEHFDELWRDHKMSDREKKKWVRNCSGTRLARLLGKVDQLLLKPLDKDLPIFIHGGVSGEFKKLSGAVIPKCPQSAAVALIDGKRKRWLLHMDLQRFFEQVSEERVFTLFHSKFKCSKSVSHLITQLCCVYKGSKRAPVSKDKVVARGFSPSVRLATWCNLEFFLALRDLVCKELKNHSPKVAIFVDDVGITAINVSREILERLSNKIIKLAEKHHLIFNNKTEIIPPNKAKEYVGSFLAKKKIFPSIETSKKRMARIRELEKSKSSNKEKMRRSLGGFNNHRNFTKKISLS